MANACTCCVREKYADEPDYERWIDYCRLHAAAPALLEALEALLETTEMNMDSMERATLADIDSARTAIAQAKGESK